MEHSIFYKPSSCGDELIRQARHFARQRTGSHITDEFLNHINGNPELAELYEHVPDHGNLHSEIGRQIRKEVGAVYPYGRRIRVRTKKGPHTSYTLLHQPP